MDRDLVIVGSGPAGMTAGLLAGRYGLETTMIERTELGGKLVNRHSIETYPGFPDGISGPELRTAIVSQLREYDLDFRLAEVTNLVPGDPITVETDAGSLSTTAVVLAAGASPNLLECAGGTEYEGRGIFDCAMCDGPLYTDEVVAVYGGGEWALEDSLYLTEFASDVLVIVPETAPSAPQLLRDRAATSDTITIETDTEIVAVDGDDVLETVRLRNSKTGDETVERVDGILVRQGVQPNTAFLEGTVSLTETGAIDVDARLATDQPGVFAAGTIRSHGGRRIAAAVGDGATAFRSVRHYLEKTPQ